MWTKFYLKMELQIYLPLKRLVVVFFFKVQGLLWLIGRVKTLSNSEDFIYWTLLK